LLSFVSLPLTRAAFRNPAGDVFSEKESHSSSEAPDTLRTGENPSGRGTTLDVVFRVEFSEENIKKAGVFTPACENIN